MLCLYHPLNEERDSVLFGNDFEYSPFISLEIQFSRLKGMICTKGVPAGINPVKSFCKKNGIVPECIRKSSTIPDSVINGRSTRFNGCVKITLYPFGIKIHPLVDHKK